MYNSTKPIVFSGAQPTGKIHIGNYVGALSLWAENQNEYNNIFCIVDLHAITIPKSFSADELRQFIRQNAALYIACGIDPEKSTIFVQSHVPAHSELTWILNCITPMGWLERMTQFKAKSSNIDTVGTGLFDYPVLMASDILLYQTDLVPVGEDQKQHIEFTRNLAERFNSLYGETFKVPKELIREEGARIMGFDDPENKMSKSTAQNKEGHSIWLLDDSDTIKKTIMRAVTDKNNEVRFEHASPGVKNLLALYEVLTGQSREKIEAHFEGKGYGFLKKELVEVVIEKLRPIQEEYHRIMNEKGYIDEVLRSGKEKVEPVANETLKNVKEQIGLL